MGRTDADRSKQDPRRWVLFHVSATKQTLLADASENLIDIPELPDTFAVSRDPSTIVAASCDIALQRPVIWRDPSLIGVFIFHDIVKRAIVAKGLRTPAFNFKPCLLV